MDEQNNDFFARLGLDTDPFPAETDSSFYHENPDLMQRLDMIQHLIGFSNQMIFVTGERGVGKTSMLDRLEYYAPDNWRICRIQANPMLNTSTLLRQLASGFDLQVSADADNLFQVYSEALQAHIQTLDRAMLTPVVLIDDAHELPVDAFTMLFGFMQQEGSQSSMKMALFCEPQITTMLESPQLKSLSQNLTHQLEIPRLDEKQTRDYLEQRLLHAGLTGEFPFLSETVHKIYKDSDGIAGKIHTLAQKALLDEDAQEEPTPLPVVDEILDFDEDEDDTFPAMSTVRNDRGSEAAIGQKFHSWQIGAVAAVLALLAGVLWLTSQFGDSPESSIAEEIPLDLTPELEKIIEQPMALDPSLFEESSAEMSQNDQMTDPISDPTMEQEIPDLKPEELAHRMQELLSTDESSEQAASSDQNIEEVIDPHKEFIQSLEEGNTQTESIHQQSEVTVQIDENGNPHVVDIEPPQKPIEQIVEEISEQVTSSDPLDAIEETIAEVQQEVVVETLPAIKPIPEPVVETPIVAAPTTPTVAEVQPIPSADIAGIKDGAWLRAQDDQLVVLQLLGTHDQVAMRKIIVENQLGGDVAWFTTTHNGDPWYVVVKGPFANRAAATASISSLTAELRGRKPWPRTIASVKKAMDKIQ